MPPVEEGLSNMAPPRAPIRSVAVAFAVIALSIVAGCVSVVDGEKGLPPLVGVKRDPGSDSGYWVVRPLAGRRSDPEAEEADFYGLWPLVRHSEKGDSTQSWLLPLWYHANYHPEVNPEEDTDGFLFPLFFYGDDPVDGRYFLFFPVAGWLKGLFGMDRIELYAFPFFTRLTQAERVSTHLLFPFINWVTGPRDHGFRIWPFYGHYTAETIDGVPKYDRRYYLWPFFIAYDNNLETQRPVRIRWFWPFYGVIRGDSFVERTVLWPILSWRTANDEPDFRLQVFPILTWRRSEIHRQTDIFPLIGFREQPGYYRHFFLFPIHRYEHTEYEGWVKDSTWILPVYWNHRSVGPDQRKREQTRWWPLASSELHEDGRWEFSALDPFPFEDDGGFHLVYRRLFQLYRSVKEPDHARSAWEFLWGAVSREETPYRSSFSILGGLFGTETDHGRSTVRILWIPF